MKLKIEILAVLVAAVLVLNPLPTIAQVDMKKMNPELGLNPEVPMPFSRRTLSTFTNIRVYESTNHQSEVSVSISPVNFQRLLCGANTDPGQGYYYSTNGGSSWYGSDRLLQTSVNATDPAVAFDRNGYAYFNFLDYVNGRYRNYVARSTDGGGTWQNAVEVPTTSTGRPDKNYMTIDVNASSPYVNHIYVVWTDFPYSNPIRFSRSTDAGATFSGNLNISGGSTIVQGAVPAVGPNGEVYVVWGIGGKPTTTGIGFNKSTNGGSSFVYSTPPTITSVTQIGTFSNDRYRLKVTQQYPNGIRVNSFPSIAVDRSSGSRNGTIYVVWADQRTGSPGSGTPDILLVKSTNGGTNWSSPVRVNDVTTGDQWFPWVDVGPDGALNVVFYDSRNDQNNLLTEVYVARSTDGGSTFTNYRVSDVQFMPVAIPGYASGYMGDYIGIVSAHGKAYPFWMDNRNDGIYQVYTAIVQPEVTITLDQQRQDGTRLSGTTVGRWNGSSFTEITIPTPPNPLPTINTTVGAREVLRGYQQIVTTSSEKYRVWRMNTDDQLDTVQNHRGFTVTSTLQTLISRFNPTEPGITIKTDLLDAPGTTGGNIQFKDPWYIDFDDPNYANAPRNRGQDGAVLYTRSVGTTGFKPDYSTPYDGGRTYKGVFLNQGNPPYWDQPYYSVGALSPQTLGGFEAYFVNWTTTAGSASFQNANAAQTGVVFSLAGTTVAARYKAHLGSNNSAVTASAAQRRLSRSASPGDLVSVYESVGDIWATTKPLGGSWSGEVRLSSGSGNNRNPSVAGSYAVWEELVPPNQRLIRWSKWQGPVTLVTFTAEPSSNSRPVVAAHRTVGKNRVHIAFNGNDGSIWTRNTSDEGTTWRYGQSYAGTDPSMDCNGEPLALGWAIRSASVVPCPKGKMISIARTKNGSRRL